MTRNHLRKDSFDISPTSVKKNPSMSYWNHSSPLDPGGVARRTVVGYFGNQSSKHFKSLKGEITEVANSRGES